MASNSHNTTNSAASSGSNKTEDLTTIVDDFNLILRVSTSSTANVVPSATSTDANVATVFDMASTSNVIRSSSGHPNVTTAFDMGSSSNSTAAPFASAAADVPSSSGSAAPTTAHGRSASGSIFSCPSDPYGGGDSGLNFPSTPTPPWLPAFVSCLSAATLRTNLAAAPRLARNGKISSATADVSLSSGSATPTTAHGRTASGSIFSCPSNPYGGGDSGFNFPSTPTPPWLPAFVSSLCAATLRTNLAAAPRLARNALPTSPELQSLRSALAAISLDDTSSDSISNEDEPTECKSKESRMDVP